MVSFGRPYASRICSIFPLCMESRALVKSTNSNVACRFFAHTPSRISELFQSKRSEGGQKKHFKDTLKVSMKSFSITPNCLEYLVQDRVKWCEVVKRGAKVCETRRNAATELHRKLRKGTAISATIPCPYCLRLFCTQIDLISHLCTHGCLPQS